MKRRSFFKIASIAIVTLSMNLFASGKKVEQELYLYSTDSLFKEVLNNIEINYDTYYSHLEYLYSTGMISYPRTKSESVSADYGLNSSHINEKDFKKLKSKRSYAIDWDKWNNHSPLTSYIKHKVDIDRAAIFTEENSEFGGMDITSEKARYGEELKHLNLIFSLIQDRTNNFYTV
jgi:hypothetical protein